MKICEANEQTLGSAKSEPIKFSCLPFGSPGFPFAFLLSLFFFFRFFELSPLCPLFGAKTRWDPLPFFFFFLFTHIAEETKRETRNVWKFLLANCFEEKEWIRGWITGASSFDISDDLPPPKKKREKKKEKTKSNWPSEGKRDKADRGSFAFQLADSCPEETLIGYKNRRENNEIIVNQYAPAEDPLCRVRGKARVRSARYSCPQDFRASI